MSSADVLVDIDPRVRIVGSLLGDVPSRRRGRSQDVVGSRPYAPGDDVRLIDWHASARLSSTVGEERFVVREFYAEEAPTVILAVDRSPSMTLYPRSLPWLHKPAALAACLRAVAESAAYHLCLATSVDSTTGEMEAPGAVDVRRVLRRLLRSPYADPADGDWLCSRLLEHQRWLPPGTVIFLFSDFLQAPSDELLDTALDLEWELVPVVISDARWELSFPEELGGMTLPLADGRGRLRPARVSRREARARREEHERRHALLVERFADAGWPPVIVTDAADEAVGSSFAEWAGEREAVR